MCGNSVGETFSASSPLRRWLATSSPTTRAVVGPLLPSAKTGRPRRDDRTTLDGVFWKLCSGAAWRDVPERYGPYLTVYDRFAKYRDDGTLDRILRALRVRLDAEGHIDHSTWMIDGTTIRASRVAAGLERRGSLTTHRVTKRSEAREAG